MDAATLRPMAPEVETPEWWLAHLSTRLAARRARMDTFQAYYDGNHPLAFATAKFRETFGHLFPAFSDNFCPLVVDAVEERLNIEGFRWGSPELAGAQPERGRSTRADQAAQADRDAWRIWQRNALDAESQKAHTTALVKSEAAAIVWANPDDPGGDPVITVEDPLEVLVATAAGNRRQRRAALKRWVSDDDHLWANVYLPDAIYKFRSDLPFRAGQGSTVNWKRRETQGEAWPLPNPLGVVPVIPLVNRPRLDGTGESELAQVLPAQDAINKLACDLLVASEFAAFRQRYALNLELPVDPTTGRPLEPWKLGVDRMLVVPPPDPETWVPGTPETSLGEFGVSDLSPYVSAIEMWVQHIATRTRTPAHYLLGQSGSFPSGESLKATETGLVAKVHRAMRHYGEAWEDVMRLAFLVAGDKARAKVMDAETIWRDPESRTESEHVDAITKMQSLGVPQVVLWEELGFSPTQIRRFEALREAEALQAGAAFDPFAGLPTLNAPQPAQDAPGATNGLAAGLGPTPARGPVTLPQAPGRPPG